LSITISCAIKAAHATGVRGAKKVGRVGGANDGYVGIRLNEAVQIENRFDNKKRCTAAAAATAADQGANGKNDEQGRSYMKSGVHR
jgi:uncharacterized protein YdbL (DUF1318 family)